MTPSPDVVADRPAEPTLFTALVDDAAVFPPGNASLPDAVAGHRVHRTSRYAAAVGPLLVPASAASRLVDLVGPDPLRVAVIGRPGTAPQEVRAGLDLLTRVPQVEVVGVEVGWTPHWRDAGLTAPGRKVSLEVPRGADQARAVADIATDASDDGLLQAKLRTGATETWAWPDEVELAAFVRCCLDHDLGFKLTGGLHHAVRDSHGGEQQHGLLNILCAVRWALDGKDADELIPLLAQRDSRDLVVQVTRMSVADAAVVRAFFTSYGCCEVTDPIGELTELGLIEGA